MCILKYFDMDVIRQAEAASSSGTSSSTLDLSKEEFFRGITIFAWVMVILLALIFIFSFDKISSRSSPWTLTVSDHDYLPLLQSHLSPNLQRVQTPEAFSFLTFISRLSLIVRVNVVLNRIVVVDSD